MHNGRPEIASIESEHSTANKSQYCSPHGLGELVCLCVFEFVIVVNEMAEGISIDMVIYL